MRKIIYAITYLAALAIGIGMLVFNHQAMETSQPMLRWVIIAAGIVFIIPGLFLLIASLRPRRDANGVIISRPWFSTGMGIISLIWGILMLCMPTGFLGNLNITLGGSLIIASLAQIVWIVKGRRVNGAPIWLYIIPLLTLASGIWVILLKTDFQNPGQEHTLGSIIAGASFILWAINGFMSLPRRKKTASDIEKEARRLARDQEKATKEEAKAAKERLAQAKANSETARRNEEAARKAAEEAQEKLNAEPSVIPNPVPEVTPDPTSDTAETEKVTNETK